MPIEATASAVSLDRIMETVTRKQFVVAVDVEAEMSHAKQADRPVRRQGWPCCRIDLMREEVVPRDGIEPPTRGFSIPCSTN